ncbi:hypothetical protein BC363_28955 [Ensifer sp. LC384]|uniref:hypothetical protein n=1 Tax=Ensifer sp. LC384 TaxID=1120653 RepID=UPI000813979D|nr:hypothetical protein [Ensifer sp. LC384]OCP21120.1 hypothetical protein BC363_28955 [Ensifer sp. LC384]
MSTTLESAATKAAGARGRYLQLTLIAIAAGAIYPILYLRQSYQTTMLEVLLLAFLLSAVSLMGMVLLPGIGSTPVLIGLILFVGLLTYAIRGLYWAILDDCNVPAHVTGLAIGIISLIGYAPDTYLPLVNGYLSDRYPGLAGYQFYFSYIAVICLLGAVATAILMTRLK